MDLRVGGSVEHIFHNSELTEYDDPPPEKYAQYAGETTMVGHILAVDPPRLLAYTWAEEHHSKSEVRFELTPVDDKVRLVLTHTKLANRGEIIGVSGGWHVNLGILDARPSGREPEPFWKLFTKMEAEYEERIQ
jgi:uncharacterized protein YndB with AHSA1/START domain